MTARQTILAQYRRRLRHLKWAIREAQLYFP